VSRSLAGDGRDGGTADALALSVATSFDYSIPIDEQMALIAGAGFTHVSLGGNEAHSGHGSPEGRARLKALLRRHGLRIDTIHGPSADWPDAVAGLTATAEAATDLGAAVVVVHGGPFDFPADELPGRLDMLLATCEAIRPVAARTGVVFALENVLPGPATDLIRQALPRLDRRAFGFCYDSSHDQIGGPRPFDLLDELGERLVAVHLSDRVREFVDHVIPGEGFIDWPEVAERLRATPFGGPLLLEVAMTHSAEKAPRRFLDLAYDRGCQLYDEVFAAKEEGS
jgi:sugar phosphate isomerase/epimerase